MCSKCFMSVTLAKYVVNILTMIFFTVYGETKHLLPPLHVQLYLSSLDGVDVQHSAFTRLTGAKSA